MCWEPRLFQRYHLNCPLQSLDESSCQSHSGAGLATWLFSHGSAMPLLEGNYHARLLWCRRAHSLLALLHSVLKKKKKGRFTYFPNISDLFFKMAGKVTAVEHMPVSSTALERMLTFKYSEIISCFTQNCYGKVDVNEAPLSEGTEGKAVDSFSAS